MLARTKTSAISGIEACAVDVEVTVRDGQPRFVIIGLGDSAVRESRDRVLSALKQSGFKIPDQILVNLAPAELKKEGAGFDLPIALGILVASGQIKGDRLADRAMYGELSLDGRVKPVRGMLALAIEAQRSGLREILVPVLNYQEARLVHGPQVVPIKSLPELVRYIGDGLTPEIPAGRVVMNAGSAPLRGLSDIWGQESAKRALIIAASGGHNLLMIGAPGCGKSMLAERMPAILPPLSEGERLEAVKNHSIAGLPIERLLAGERPFRSPHHVISEAGLVGGGPIPRPGEISLAHHGVLFLDEFPEFRRPVIEALRAPLEARTVRITRAKASYQFPADVQLIAAMNPCPCGRLGDKRQSCRCSQSAIQKYLQKLSQPILDRIDLHVEMEAVPLSVLTSAQRNGDGDEDEKVRRQVVTAREKQLQRSGRINARLAGEELKKVAAVSGNAIALLERAANKLGLSARGFVRVLRVARTIADLDDAQNVGERHIAEAVGYRCLERLGKFCSLS